MSLGASLDPMQEMGMNFKHQGTIDCRQNIEMPLFLNSSKSKTRLKFMKLGMLSWNGDRHDVVFFVSILREGALDNDSQQRHF